MPDWIAHVAALVALLASPASAPPARAELDPRAAAIIERYLQVTGGRAAFEAESTLHVKGRLVSGGASGPFEMWLRRPDCMAIRMTLGTLRTRSGCRGAVAWRTDLASKKVTTLDGKDLEAEQADAWFEACRWAEPGQGGGKVALGSTSYLGRHQRQALEITPPIGRPRTLWFDAKSGLLDRVRHERDNGEADEWLTGYALRAGRKRPLEFRADDPEAYGGEEGITLDSVWTNVPLAASLFDPPEAKGDGVTWLKARGAATIPFRYGGRAVWVRASMDGAPPADFLLDTGCSITALDRDYAAGLGLASEGATVVQGVGALARASFATLKRVRLSGPGGDGVEVRGLKVSLVDLGEDMEDALGRRAVGMIGSDFISRFVTELDYDHEVVRLRDPSGFVYAGGGAGIAMGLAQGVPTVELTVDADCSGTFIVDTGNSTDLAIHGSMARRCGLARQGRKALSLYSGGLGGSFPEWLGRLDSLRLGPYGWKAPLAGISLHSRGMVGSEDYSGNIGNSVLERFKCTFDYAHGRLYLEPGARYGARDSYSRLGATLVRHHDRVFTVGIVSDSPADSAGLESMDEVKKIDGRPVLEYTREQLDRLFVEGPVGSRHQITVTRDFKDVDVEVVLHDVI